MTVDYRVGDTRDVIATIPDGSVDLIASSPPFLALRSYLPAGHASKHAEIGSEANPAAFIDCLLALTAEWGRVLAPHGSIAIELGDTYAGGNVTQSGWHRQGRREGLTLNYRQDGAGVESAQNGGAGWPQAKSLALIPQLYAVALAYGINPLTGQASPAGRWRVRNVIVWHRPNPAVGALGDKYRPSTSYIVVATRSAKRWFDLTAVRTAFTGHEGVGTGIRKGQNGSKPEDNRPNDLPTRIATHAGAPPLDCWLDYHDTWTLTTQPSSLAHYAMWPAKLAERLILSMSPHAVCRTCGEARRRVERTEYIETPNRDLRNDAARSYGSIDGKRHNDHRGTRQNHEGWTDCGCDGPCGEDGGCAAFPLCTWCETGFRSKFRPGLVLDPFAGTGTTLAVAELHGRDSIGIDVDARNQAIYPARYNEVKRALYGTQPEMPGQLAML